MTRIIKGFLDLLTVKFLTGFGQRPQHLLGAVGLGSFALGSLGLIVLAAWWVVSRMVPGMEVVHLHERPAMIYSVGLMLLGGQLMSIGFLAELIIAYHTPDLRGYSISERTFSEHAPPSSQRTPPADSATGNSEPAAPSSPRQH